MAYTNWIASHMINASPVQRLKRSHGDFGLLFRSSCHWRKDRLLVQQQYFQKSHERRHKVVADKMRGQWCINPPQSCWRVPRCRISGGAAGSSVAGVAARRQHGCLRTALVPQQGEGRLEVSSLERRNGWSGILLADRSVWAPIAVSGAGGGSRPQRCGDAAPATWPSRLCTRTRVQSPKRECPALRAERPQAGVSGRQSAELQCRRGALR